jgi:hypothetical protein
MSFVGGTATARGRAARSGSARYLDPIVMAAFSRDQMLLPSGALEGPYLLPSGALEGPYLLPSGALEGMGVLPALVAAIPSVIDAIGKVFGSHHSLPDPIAAVWQKIPPEAINAKVGSGGWWYDNADGHQLTHEEAAARQQALVASTVGATVGGDGWWVDDSDGHQLTHAEVWERYQALYSGTAAPGGQGLPRIPSGMRPTSPSTGQLVALAQTPHGKPAVKQGGMMPADGSGTKGYSLGLAGITMSPTVLLIGAAAVYLLFLRKR